MHLLRYNTVAVVQFVLYTADGTALQPSATLASGDVKILKDQGTATNTTNLPTNEGNGVYSLSLTAAEMAANQITITIDDATATETFLGTHINIETFGGGTPGSSTMARDLSALVQDANMTQITSSSARAGTLASQLDLVVTASPVTDAGNTTSSFITGLTATTDDLYNHRVLKFIAGNAALVGVYGFIRDYDGTTKTLTTNTLPAIPTDSDTFIIV